MGTGISQIPQAAQRAKLALDAAKKTNGNLAKVTVLLDRFKDIYASEDATPSEKTCAKMGLKFALQNLTYQSPEAYAQTEGLMQAIASGACGPIGQVLAQVTMDAVKQSPNNYSNLHTKSAAFLDAFTAIYTEKDTIPKDKALAYKGLKLVLRNFIDKSMQASKEAEGLMQAIANGSSEADIGNLVR